MFGGCFSSKVCELSESSNGEELEGNISYLKGKERGLLLLLMKNYKREFTPIEVSKELKVTNSFWSETGASDGCRYAECN